MNGARSLLRTLVDLGVDTCFANPGTSEMHFVAALDEVPEMRAVLALFEGVATGAADGYGRMRGHPAATLLHLGPGLANGTANLHNARRARTPVLNVVGDHATYHHRLDAPLESDIAAVASTVSGWYRSCARPDDLAADAADAVAAALGPPGQVATLVLPADVSWEEAKDGALPRVRRTLPSRVPTEQLASVIRLLRSDEPTALLLGGSALRGEALDLAARLAAGTGARLLAETFPARMARGAGRPAVDRLAYLPELSALQLEGLRHLVLVEASAPVSFFAYPGVDGDLVPEGCQVTVLSEPGQDAVAALEGLCGELDVPVKAPAAPEGRPGAPSGPLDAVKVAEAVGHLLPEDAVVVDEANTGGVFAPTLTAGCPPHDWLCLTGGAIGQGMPVATGAAVAAPERRVVNLQADGSALYTLQALWTQAREGLDVTTVVYANRSYAILNLELSRVGAAPAGARAARLLDLGDPVVDWCSLAAGLGVPARRVEDGAQLTEALGRSLVEPGPSLIEVRLPTELG